MTNQTKKSSIFDRSIYITLGVICLLCLFITGYKMIYSTSYRDASFTIETQRMVAGKVISFKALTPHASEWKWTFGDDSKPATQKNVMNVYKYPGEYWVELEVDGEHTIRKKITIQEKKSLVNTILYPMIDGPVSATVGEPVQFVGHAEGAKTWEWSFGETMQIDATTQNATYTFQTTGTKTVALIVNGREQFVSRKQITVLPKPIVGPDPVPDPPKKRTIIEPVIDLETVIINDNPTSDPLVIKQEEETIEITQQQLQDYLLQVAKEAREPETLKQYFCKEYDTQVQANDEFMPLNKLLQYIKGYEITITRLDVYKSKHTRCIDYLKINYSKEKAIGLF